MPGFKMADAPELLTDALADEVRGLLEKYNQRCVLLGCYLNLCSPDLSAHERTLMNYRAHLRFGKKIGALMVGTETGAPNIGYKSCPECRTEESLRLFIERVKPVVRWAEEEGMMLAIEPGTRHSVCTAEKREKNNVIDFLHYPKRIYPVGRLDKESEGLLLLTNNGEIVNKIMRSGNMHEKEYLVTVNRPVTDAFLHGMANGVPLVELGTTTRKCRVERTGKKQFRIILTQGLNRQIRRMCEYFGYRVQKLVRVRIMNIELGDLESGKYRDVTPEEFKKLKQLIAHSSNQPVRPMEKPQKSKRKPRNSAIHGTYTVVNHHIDRENKNGNRKATD